MTQAAEEDLLLREVRNAVFGEVSSIGRAYVQFFSDAMRWPVDAFVTRTAGGTDHHVTWLKGRAVGHASLMWENDEPSVSAIVRPLDTVVRVEINAKVRDDGFTQAVSRSMIVHFTDDDAIVVDPFASSIWMQREQAQRFIDAVLDAVGRPSEPLIAE